VTPTDTTAPPVAEGLFDPAGPNLLASRCRICGTDTFPSQDNCPCCSGLDVEVVALPRAGTLWTWTSQSFRPKTPPYLSAVGADAFKPFLLGYVELGRVRVEGTLVELTVEQVEIGMAMETVLVPFEQNDGTTRTTYAFKPAS
jgi:uncharacterized OB-fold protein